MEKCNFNEQHKGKQTSRLTKKIKEGSNFLKRQNNNNVKAAATTTTTPLQNNNNGEREREREKKKQASQPSAIPMRDVGLVVVVVVEKDEKLGQKKEKET